MPSLLRKYGIYLLLVAIALAAYFRHVVNIDSGIILIALVPSVILHEVSHGYVALYFGDRTAKNAHRLTLNPIAHIDPLGSLILPAVLTIAGITPIGYAKPVPVNVGNLRKPRNQAVWVSLAGPVTNIILAVILGVLLHARLNHEIASATAQPIGTAGGPGTGFIDRLMVYGGLVNVNLAVFNLIPIPPLDGSAVLERFIPDKHLPAYYDARRFLLPVVIMIFLFFPIVATKLFTPFQNMWAGTFIP